jgi:endonuclease-3
MIRESLSSRRERAEAIVAKLKTAYPEARCELTHGDPLQLLVATILSAQCSDKQVNLVTGNLFKKYPTARDFAEAPVADIEKQIQRLGLFRNKAKNIQAACRLLVEKHGGQVPASMDELIQLNGVGRKTANVVLGNAFGINEGIVVDTHVARLSNRLALSGNAAPEKIEQDLARLIPRGQWMLFSHLMIFHGRRRCHARRPDCQNCEIKELCPIGRKMPAEKLASRRHSPE